MRKRSKHGFTIVELVIVIAVIGILTAILIPLFVNLTGKAQERDNQSFVRNINTQLAMNEAEKGFKNSAMEDSIKLAQNMGFDVTKITPYNNNDIVWDSVHDRFAILKSDYAQDKNQNKEHVVYADASFDVKTPLYQLWKVYAEYPDPDKTNQTQTYSIYAKEAEAWDNKEIKNLHVGFDAGKNTKIKSVQYVGSGNSQDSENSPKVVIRTNGGMLTVDAEYDTVKHYGKASLVNIEAINTSSYHEYGNVESAQIKRGHIVIESSDASIGGLLLVANDNADGFDDIIVETKAGAIVPELDRTYVTISSTGTLVFNLVTPTTDEYIYLTKAGVIEQIVVTEEKKNDVSSETMGVSGKTATTKSAAEQIANVGKKNEDGTSYVDSNGNDISLEELTSNNVVLTETKANQNDIIKGNTEFAGGAGVSASPYLVSTLEQFKKIDNINYSGKEFLLTDDITIDVKDFTNRAFIANFNGVFDGGNHRINITNTTDIADLDTTAKANVYRIFDKIQGKLSSFVVVNQTGYVCSIVGTGSDSSPYELAFENVDYGYEGINATIEMKAQDCGLFVQTNVGNVSFSKCNNYYNIVSDPVKVGIFVGGRAADKDTSSIKYSFDSCNNYGDIRATVFGILIGNANNNRSITNTTITNCHNYGSLIASTRIGFINDGNSQKIIDENWNGSLINHSSISIMNDGTKLTADSANYPNYLITKGAAEVSKYVLVFAESLHFTNDVNYSYKLSFEIAASSLHFENGQADSGFNSCQLVPKTVHEAEVGADKYTTEWLTDEGTGVKYAYSVYVDSYGRNCGAVVIDVNPSGCTYIGTGIAGVTLYGYDANGDLVAFALLSK